MTDINLQKVQKDISKGITAMCQFFMLAQNSAQDKQLLTDAISLTANASHSIDVFMGMAFRPELNKEYAVLCADSTYNSHVKSIHEHIPEFKIDISKKSMNNVRVKHNITNANLTDIHTSYDGSW